MKSVLTSSPSVDVFCIETNEADKETAWTNVTAGISRHPLYLRPIALHVNDRASIPKQVS